MCRIRKIKYTVAKAKTIKTYYQNSAPQNVSSQLELEVTTYTRLSNGKVIHIGEIYDGEYRFKAGEYITSRQTNTAVYITGVRDMRYSVIDFEPSYLKFTGTDVYFEMRPYSNGNPGSPQGWHSIIPSKNYFYDKEMAVYSRSHEFLYYNGAKTNKVRAILSTSSDYVSPVIDMLRTSSIFVDQIINANNYATSNVYASYPGECQPNGGEILNKYISVPITLAVGQDAEDLLVMITAYRPPGTDVLVFAKLLNGQDTDTLAQRPWIPLVRRGDNVYSSFTNRSDFKEYSYDMPPEIMTGQPSDNSSGGEFQYYNSQGVLFTGYKYYQIKVALTGTDSTIVPKVSDLRAIALQI